MECMKIILTDNEINKLKHRLVGGGTESDIYRANNSHLYKIYKPFDILRKEVSFYNDSELEYLYSEPNIIEATYRQKYVHLTSLPLGVIHDSDKEFIGCVLKRHKQCFPIHAITLLPRKKQIIILKRLLLAVKELCDNNIYHKDLSVNEIDGKKHSNILVDRHLNPQIIDLDGKSTIYSNGKNDSLNYSTFVSLNSLILEILFNIDTSIDKDYYETETDIKRISQLGYDYDIVDSLVRCECNYDDLNELLSLSLK